MIRWLKIAAVVAAALIALPILAAAAGYGWLQTEAGRRWAEARLSTASDGQIAVERLEGAIPFAARAQRLVLSDAEGPWLTASGIRLSVAPGALLRLRLRVELAAADRIEVLRLPRSQGSVEEAEGPPALPRLPVAVEIERLQAPDILLALPVLGQEARLSLSGSGALRDGTAELALALKRLDAAGDGAVDLAYDGERLRFDANLQDPGGLVGRALGAQQDLPFTLHASGEGPLGGWTGKIEARLASAASRLAVETSGAQMHLTGSLDPRPLLPPDLAGLLPEPLRIEAEATLVEPKTLKRIALASGANRIAFEGALRLDDLTGSGTAELALPDASLLQPVLGRGLEGALTAQARIETAADGQSAELHLDAHSLAIEGYAAETLSVDATGRRPAGAKDLQLSGVAQGTGIARKDGAGAVPIPANLRLAFDGTIDPGSGRLEARSLSLTGEGAEIRFAGAAGLHGLLDGTLAIQAPEIAPFAQIAGLNWSGAVSLEARLRASPGSGSTEMELDGTWRNPDTGIAVLDAALGEALSLSAAAAMQYDGSVELQRAEASTDAATVSLSGHLDPAGALDARFEASLVDLGPIGAAVGRPLGGSVKAAGTVTGTRARPNLSLAASAPELHIAGRSLSAVALTAELEAIVPDLQGRISASATVEGVPATFDSAVALAGGVLSLANLELRSNGTRAAGALSIVLDTSAIDGALDVSAADLSPWSKLAGIALRGEARGHIALQRDGSATAEVNGSALKLAEVEIGVLAADARLQRWRTDPAGRIDIRAERVRAGEASIDRATARIEPHGERYELSLSAAGAAAAPFKLEGQGRYDAAAERLAIASLSGRFADKPVRLQKPTSIAWRGGLSAEPFDLAWGEAKIGGALSLGAKLDGRIRVSGVPIEDLAGLAGNQDVKGVLDGSVVLSGSAADPQAKFETKIAGLTMAGALRAAPVGALAMNGTLGRDRLDFAATLTSGTSDLSLSASGALPVAWRDPPFGLSIDATGPVRAKIGGSGEIGPLIALIGVGEDRASGRYTLDVAIAGRLDAPAISGTAQVENGRYENFASGAVLRDISLKAAGAGEQMTLTLAATDGEGGRIDAEGALRFSGVALAALDASARLTEFRALRRDDVRAQATGNLALAGPLDGLALSGAIRLDRMQIVLPETNRLTAPKLDVVEVNADAASGERVTRTNGPVQAGPPALEIGLDVKARLPEVEVTGRGLRSEWHGDVAVKGTTAAPQISGGLTLRRGTFSVLGKTFSLVEGRIVFDGGADFDPSIRVVAERSVRDAVARATLTGSLSSPLLDFSARPDLPVDEVLARLLFDKSAGQVGAAEALQLAQAAAALRGGGTSPGMLEDLGRKFGLDRIDVSTVETEDEKGKAGEAAALSVGKDLGEDVRVGVEQGLEPGTGSVSVEVDLGKNLSVESKVGAQSGSGVGLKWEYDY